MFYFIFPGCVCVVVSFMQTSLFSSLTLSLPTLSLPLSRWLALVYTGTAVFFLFFQARRIKHLSQETAGESSDVRGRIRGNTVLFLLLLLL